MCSGDNATVPAALSAIPSIGTLWRPTGSNCEPLQRSHHTLPPKPPRAERPIQVTLAENNADLRRVRRLLRSAERSDHDRMAYLRKEHERLLRETLRLGGLSGAGGSFHRLQSEADSEAMTERGFLSRLKTLSEVEPILSFINLRLRWATSHGTKGEISRLEVHQHRARMYRQELSRQNNHVSRLLSEITTGPLNSQVIGVATARPLVEKDDPAGAMADLVTDVSRLTRKVNELQRSMGSGKKSATTEALGIALLAAIQELLDRTKSLTGKPAGGANLQDKHVDQDQVPASRGYTSLRYIDDWESDAGGVKVKSR